MRQCTSNGSSSGSVSLLWDPVHPHNIILSLFTNSSAHPPNCKFHEHRHPDHGPIHFIPSSWLCLAHSRRWSLNMSCIYGWKDSIIALMGELFYTDFLGRLLKVKKPSWHFLRREFIGLKNKFSTQIKFWLCITFSKIFNLSLGQFPY